MTTSSDKIAEALFECLVNASAEDQDALFSALKEYETKFSRTYSSIMQRQPVARKLIEAIQEAAAYSKGEPPCYP